MDKIWDISLEYLTKINLWIPLVAVLWAGIGLVAVTLILAITGCALRKRLVPQWLIWTYFIASTIVIFAQSGNNIFTVVANMEIPCLVVLLCYLFRLVFYRRPRYTYVEQAVYARELAKGRVVEPNDATNDNVDKNDKNDNVENAENNDDNNAREVENIIVVETNQAQNDEKDKAIAISRKEQRKAEKAAREYEKAAREAERAAREAEEKAAAEKERAEREIAAAKKAAQAKAAAEVEAAEKAARAAEERAAAEKEKAAREIAAAKKAAAEKVAQANAKTTTTSTATFDLPVVEPIPDKTYTATSEPTITVTPVSETMPDLKMPNTTIQLRYNNTVSRPAPRPATSTTTRPASTTTTATLTTRPTTTTVTTTSPNRVVTTETTTTPVNAYTQMYNPRIVKTTTTTTTTTTNTNSNTLNAVSATRTVNGNTTGAAAIKATATSNNSTSPRSTEDIMAAIERLRASMKK